MHSLSEGLKPIPRNGESDKFTNSKNLLFLSTYLLGSFRAGGKSFPFESWAWKTMTSPRAFQLSMTFLHCQLESTVVCVCMYVRTRYVRTVFGQQSKQRQPWLRRLSTVNLFLFRPPDETFRRFRAFISVALRIYCSSQTKIGRFCGLEIAKRSVGSSLKLIHPWLLSSRIRPEKRTFPKKKIERKKEREKKRRERNTLC